MQPVYHPLVKIFGHEIRHTVPLFQRPYVWSKDENWEPLWDDLKSLANRVFANDGKQPVAGHFLGTVVLEQALNQTGSISCREVIDGQQRLTTLQIILKAATHVLAQVSDELTENETAMKKSVGISAKQIGALIANPAYADDEERYKVWPTNEDRLPFRYVMDADDAEAIDPTHSRMAEAYQYFFGVVKEWLQTGDGMSSRAQALASALKDHLRLIVLDLDNTDEPQAIFETLNAHGTPLLPADLMKNWLLWQAQKQSKKIEQLYSNYWRDFDRDADYWRSKIGTGHASRSRVDTFLQYWLTRRTQKAIATKHLYDEFLRHVTPARAEEKVDVPALMADIRDDAARFVLMDKPQGAGRLTTFFRRLKLLDVSVFYPFLLELMGRSAPASDRESIAECVESYLVRRVVCGAQTRGYGTLALALMDTIRKVESKKPAAPFVRTFLSNLSDTDAWPDDPTFKEEWVSRKFYGGLRRERVAMILQAIEEHYHRGSSKSEPIVHFDYSALQIEHILPQEWEKHWPLAKSDAQGVSRSKHLHGIGNLTLVSHKLNPSLSHAAWLDEKKGEKTKLGKRSALKEHSKLQMNARLISQYPKRWDELTIDARAAELFAAAQTIWVPPTR